MIWIRRSVTLTHRRGYGSPTSGESNPKILKGTSELHWDVLMSANKPSS